jgi:class 3 adenylate cyclase
MLPLHTLNMVKLDPQHERQIRKLRFEGPLERQFKDFFAEDSLLRLRVGLILLALLTVPQIVMEFGGPPAPLSSLSVARLWIGGPIPVIIIALTFWRGFRRFAVPSAVFFQLLMHSLPVIFGERHVNMTPHIAYTFVSAILVIAAIRLPTFTAAIYAALAWGFFLLNIVMPPQVEGAIPSALIMLFGMILLIVGAYFNETAVRRSFLLGQLLEEERAKTEAVLDNTLPKPIAERLKSSKEPIAEFHPEASVLFVDIVEFTTYAATHQPSEVVALLNDLFSQFDSLAGAYSLEKIKTVGDAYMVAGGVVNSTPNHARHIARLALDMIDIAVSIGVGVRIGIDSGPVVAGVLGTSKYSYDLWGTTVNRASRMQTLGKANAIHVTDAFAVAAGDEFKFESSGEQDLKGIGSVQGFWLLDRKAVRIFHDSEVISTQDLKKP